MKNITKSLFFLSCSILLSFTHSVALADSTKLGVIVPLTGSIAEYGVAIKNGITLAQSENSEQFKNCTFAFEDSAYVSSQAVSAFNKLVNEGADIIYVFGGPMGEVISALAESRSFPLLTDSIDPRVAQGRNFIIRYANKNTDYGAVLSKHLLNKGIKEVDIIQAENQYIERLVSGFKDAAATDITVNEIASVQPSDKDLKFLIPKVLKSKPKALGLFLFPGQLSSFARQLESNNLKPFIFGGDFLESPQEVKDSKGYLEGALYPNNKVDQNFQRKYLEKFKNEAQIKFAAEGYDVATVVSKQLCSQNKKLSNTEVIELLAATKPFKGALGETKLIWDENDKYFSSPVVPLAASADTAKILE